MNICVGFHNGLGNWVLFTSILQALENYSGNKITLCLDDDFVGEVREGVELTAREMPFIDKIISYQKEYNEYDYDLSYMTAHSVMTGGLYKQIFTDSPDPNLFTSWASSYLGELDFLYLELYRQLDYKGPIFPQYWPSYSDFEKSPFLYDLRVIEDPKIVVSNGWRRSPENRMASKAYPHWGEVILKVKELHEDVKFILVGGKDDREWAKEIIQLLPEEDCYSFVGKSNLLETGDIIRICDCCLSTDTGVAHVADALNKKGVMVFSSTLHSKNYPINKTMVPIRSPLSCSPCQGTILFNMCGENERCAEAVSPKYIVSVVRKILNERSLDNGKV